MRTYTKESGKRRLHSAELPMMLQTASWIRQTIGKYMSYWLPAQTISHITAHSELRVELNL